MTRMAAALAAAAACVSVGYATATPPPPPGSLPSPAWHATKSGLATMDNRAAHTSFYNLIPAHSPELKDVTYTQLYMNWPVFDGFQVAPGTPFYSVYHYFKLDYTGSTAGQGFRVMVSMYSGDVDLYGSDASNTAPNATSCQYFSASDFNEYINIPEGSGCSVASPCTYYFSTTPFLNQNSSYMILPSFNGSPVPLADGTPVDDSLETNEDKSYTFQWTPQTASSTLNIEVEAVSGVPYTSIFIGTNSTSGNTADFYMYDSGVTAISLAGLSTTSCTVGSQCSIAIKVHGASATTFTITATTGGQAEQLQNGIPTIGIVANAEFRYYTFTSTVDTNISVTLTALAGDPDIFISTTVHQPNMASNDWAGIGFTNEFVRIRTTDAAYVAPPGTYYISVYGWGATNSYSLVVTQEVANFTVRLLNGQPQAGRTLTSHSFRYYMYNVSQDLSTAQSIDFIATPLRGDVDLYISTVGAYNPASGFVEPVFPSVSCEAYMPDFPSVCASWVVNPYTYTWSSVNSQMVDYITVPTTTLSAGQMLIVGVLATTPDSGGGILAPVSTYVLTGASTDAWVDLQDGVPTAGIVAASGSKYYTLTLTAANVDIAISAHTTRGALDLYVSESDQHPSAGSSQWNATSSGGFVPFDNVYIPFGTLSGSCRLRLNFGLPCTLYIAAVGYSGMPTGTQCLYSITGSMSGSPSFPQTLVENSPSIAHITANTYQYFTTTASINAGESMYAIVRDLSGTSQMWLVVGNNSTKTFASPQNNFQADAYSVDMGGYTRIIVTPTGIVTSTDGKSLQQIPFVGASPYCTSCPIYITVGSGSSTAPADVAVSYVEGATVKPLQNDVASTGLVPTNGAAYFSFNVGQPSANLSITITPIWGAVDAYITVQSPSRPYLMPSNRTWLWQMHPSSGERTLVIPTTDPHYCVSTDGSVESAPCTFVIAVQGESTFLSPYFTILATADTGNSFVRLVDGKPQAGSVAEGQYTYYTFDANAFSAGVVSPIRIGTSSAIGSVELYITNQYTPGVSPDSALPSAGNRASCQWTATAFPSVTITSADTCFNPNAQFYTIGVLGASGIPGLTTNFIITATDNAAMAIPLDFGMPTTGVFLRDNATATFEFYLPDASQDITISATPSSGEIALLVAPIRAGVAPPTCYQAAGGTQARCSGYTWMATGVHGATSFRIPAASPCSPVTGSGLQPILVNSTTCVNGYLAGAYYVVIYAWTDSVETSVSVQVSDQPMQLFDGEPQLALSTPIQFCAQRDATTGACTSAATTAMASILQFTIPASLAGQDEFLMVERLCPDGTMGYCGDDLFVSVSSCNDLTCNVMDAFPYWGYNDVNETVNDAQGALVIPSCYNGPLPLGAPDCRYTVTIFPVCNGVGSTPGVGCNPALVRAIWSGVSAADRIPADCYAPGKWCTLPSETVSLNTLRTYQAYASDDVISMQLQLQACAGDLELYYCTLASSSKCIVPERPGPNNFDGQAFTSTTNTGVAQLSASVAGPFFIGVFASQGSPVQDSQFVLSLSTGNALTLELLPEDQIPSVTRDPATNAAVTVLWQPPVLSYPGGQTRFADAAIYGVYAFPQGLGMKYNLESACGVSAAFNNAPNVSAVFTRFTSQRNVTLSGLDPSKTYNIAVVAICPAGTCMPGTAGSQSVAYMPLGAQPVPPQPSQTPAPAPQPNNGGKPGNGGAVAGGVIGALLGVAIIGGLVWYFMKKRAAPTSTYGNLGGDDGFYANEHDASTGFVALGQDADDHRL